MVEAGNLAVVEAANLAPPRLLPAQRGNSPGLGNGGSGGIEPAPLPLFLGAPVQTGACGNRYRESHGVKGAARSRRLVKSEEVLGHWIRAYTQIFDLTMLDEE